MKVSGWRIPMTTVTDSKDGHDRLNSEEGVGSAAQKPVNLELGSIREILDRTNTTVHWTETT